MAGIGEDRLHLAWVSSAEAQRFVQVVNNTVDAVRQAGKFEPDKFKLELQAAERTVTGEIVRWLVGKEVKITTKGDVYGRPWDPQSFETILDTVLEREYQKSLILMAIKAGCKSPRDVAPQIGLELKRISYLLADMEKTGMVEFKGMEDCKPMFAAL